MVIAHFQLANQLVEALNNYKIQTEIFNSSQQTLSNHIDAIICGRDVPINDLRILCENNFAIPVIVLDEFFDETLGCKILQETNCEYLYMSSVEPLKFEKDIKLWRSRLKKNQILKHENNTLSNIFNSIVDPLFTILPNLQIVEGNRSFYAFFNSSKTKWGSVSLREILPEQYDLIRKKITQNKAIQGIEVIVKISDKTIPCLFSIWPVKNALGETIHYHGLLHDLTDRLIVENEMKRAEKMAMISRLTRSVAHEVRNPLNNINLSLDGLKTEIGEDDSLDMYLEIIQRNANRINNLITELLDSSKPAALKTEKVAVRNIANGVISLAGDRFRLKQVRLVQKLNTSNLYIKADAKKLEIALLNIIINAIEAVQSQTGKIIFGCDVCEENNFVVFKVEDNGIGLDQDELKVLFDPFYTNKKGGVGLGLTTTQNIINAHQGRIEVASAKGKGTTFNIFIPVVNEPLEY